MVGSPRINGSLFSLIKTSSRIVKKRTIVVGLKSDNSSREMLLRCLDFIVTQGDNVLAVHVQDSNDSFDPNTFHIHEDLCKSKQVEFQVKVCIGSSYMAELSHQVRINFATILAIGCSDKWPEDSNISKFLKTLPPSCSLLVINNGGKILVQKQGTSQQGSANNTNRMLQYSVSSIAFSNKDNSEARSHLQKSLTMPCPSSSSSLSTEMPKLQHSSKKRLNPPPEIKQRLFEKLAALEVKGQSRRFTLEELKRGTNNFSPEMLIGEGGNSKVYRAFLDRDPAVAVKALDSSKHSEEDLLREVEILSGLKHENVVKLLGYCYCRNLKAVVYDLLEASLRQKLKQLQWGERMQIAIGVAKALDYLHSSNPPIIHRDVKSSNILLAKNCQPQLSDFGGAIVHDQIQQTSVLMSKPIHVVGTFGYLAPEYMMYGKIDEKIDVYSYGVVLLELITGKEAIQSKSTSNQESLVLWARSLLSSGLCERLIDPNLNDYDMDEMKTMMISARLCLLHSSSRRPTMKKILHLFEEPQHWLEMQRKRDELLNVSSSKERCRLEESNFNESILMEDG